ncbi:uncharacterized protein LOC116802149 [Drosophila sechellia]|uniref:uncharacterized protein LOC116802149 n=1 Tax=Drosophila sechellia TaxID=7238 RepID=UPI0013DE4F5B|nr:uncharacterized protein LOC116802149 [Drosophila sechellia]
MSGTGIAGIELTCGPTHLKSRILVRNLPPCTRQELSLLCVPYGRIVGSLVIDTYGYIQFNSLTEAKRAIESLNLFIFKSQALRVSNASISSLKATFSGIARPNRRRIEWYDADEVILVERIKYDDDENNDDDDNDEVENDSESDDDEGQKSRTRKRKRKTNAINPKRRRVQWSDVDEVHVVERI